MRSVRRIVEPLQPASALSNGSKQSASQMVNRWERSDGGSLAEQRGECPAHAQARRAPPGSDAFTRAAPPLARSVGQLRVARSPSPACSERRSSIHNLLSGRFASGYSSGLSTMSVSGSTNSVTGAPNCVPRSAWRLLQTISVWVRATPAHSSNSTHGSSHGKLAAAGVVDDQSRDVIIDTDPLEQFSDVKRVSAGQP